MTTKPVVADDVLGRLAKKQVERWSQFFAPLDNRMVETITQAKINEAAEGWLVIPKPEVLAPRYGDALFRMVNLLAQSRVFHDFAGEGSGMRPAEKTSAAYRVLNKQPGDFWCFPFQFGKRWAGHSARNAKARFLGAEFGLGPYEIAAAMFLHPERIASSNSLAILCGGWEYTPEDCPQSSGLLQFYGWSDENLSLYYNFPKNYDERHGVATGFAPPRQ